ncbi:hypothetical protein SD340_004396 [Vibrio fluvialis]|nr:hypothetical protein [Vibrio fluvialis]ELU8402477.1 hypothetical protein [Vibrio fluvialis]
MNKPINSNTSESQNKAPGHSQKFEDKKTTNIATSKPNKRDASGSLGDEQPKNGECRDVKSNETKASKETSGATVDKTKPNKDEVKVS